MTTAHVDTSSDAGGGLVRLVVAGEVDLSNADDVEEALLTAIGNEATVVSVDLAGVAYIDSAGLRVLYSLASRLGLLQIALEVIVPPGSPARRAVELSGLDSVARVLPGPPPPPA